MATKSLYSNSTKKNALWGRLFLLFLFPLCFSCLDMDQEDLGNDPTAYVSFFNGIHSDQNIKIEVDNKVYDPRPFDFGHYIDYWYFYTGERNFSFKNPATNQSVLDTTVTLKVDKAYSFFMTEDGNNLSTLFVEDSLSLPQTGKASLRLVHLSSDTPSVNLFQRNKDQALIANREFKALTKFTNLDPGATDFILKASDSGEELARLNDVTIKEGRIYTLVIRGQMNAESNSQDALRIQLIRNYPNY